MADVEVIARRAMIVCAIEAAVGSSEPLKASASAKVVRPLGRQTAEVPKERWTCYRSGTRAVTLSQMNPSVDQGFHRGLAVMGMAFLASI
jgi:hypothetical protein